MHLLTESAVAQPESPAKDSQDPWYVQMTDLHGKLHELRHDGVVGKDLLECTEGCVYDPFAELSELHEAMDAVVTGRVIGEF